MAQRQGLTIKPANAQSLRLSHFLAIFACSSTSPPSVERQKPAALVRLDFAERFAELKSGTPPVAHIH
jgi:hypothetical protein